jgi:hypothetical protein
MRTIILFFLLAAFAAAQLPIGFDPHADAVLNGQYPNQNYGSTVKARIFQDGTRNHVLICRFNISAMPATITKAEVVYFQEFTISDEMFGPFVVFNAFKILSNWTESTVTLNSYPAKVGSAFLTDYQDNDIERLVAPVTTVYRAAKTANEPLLSFSFESIYPYLPIYLKGAPSSYAPYMLVYV